MKVFLPSVRITSQKPRAFVSVRGTNQIALFPLFFFSVLFARFHFKVIRKSLYQYIIKSKSYENQLVNALILYQILSRTILRKCVEIRRENLYGDIGV